MLHAILPSARLLIAVAVFQEAQPAEAPSANFTSEIREDLSARDLVAADLFDRANAARDRLDLVAAELLYRGVLTHAPGFDHAHRRLCGVVMQLGRRADAVDVCQRALRLSDSAENRVALAAVLMTVTEENRPSSADYETAAGLLAQDHPGRLLGATGIIDDCRVGIEAGAVSTIRACVEQLDAVTGREEAAHYFAWLWGALSGEWVSTSVTEAHYAGWIED